MHISPPPGGNRRSRALQRQGLSGSSQSSRRQTFTCMYVVKGIYFPNARHRARVRNCARTTDKTQDLRLWRICVLVTLYEQKINLPMFCEMFNECFTTRRAFWPADPVLPPLPWMASLAWHHGFMVPGRRPLSASCMLLVSVGVCWCLLVSVAIWCPPGLCLDSPRCLLGNTDYSACPAVSFLPSRRHKTPPFSSMHDAILRWQEVDISKSLAHLIVNTSRLSKSTSFLQSSKPSRARPPW